jgi:hypothetical protein
MAATIPSVALVPVIPVFTNTERLALAGFLAGYSGLTRQAYELDLRQYAAWCQQHQLRLFAARRVDIECFARDLEIRGRGRATITRRLCTISLHLIGTFLDNLTSAEATEGLAGWRPLGGPWRSGWRGSLCSPAAVGRCLPST